MFPFVFFWWKKKKDLKHHKSEGGEEAGEIYVRNPFLQVTYSVMQLPWMQNQLKVENETRKVGQKNKKHANTVEFREK